MLSLLSFEISSYAKKRWSYKSTLTVASLRADLLPLLHSHCSLSQGFLKFLDDKSILAGTFVLSHFIWRSPMQDIEFTLLQFRSRVWFPTLYQMFGEAESEIKNHLCIVSLMSLCSLPWIRNHVRCMIWTLYVLCLFWEWRIIKAWHLLCSIFQV